MIKKKEWGIPMTKKTFLYAIVAVMLFLITWIIYSVNQPPEWVGLSKGKEWKTTFEDELSPKGYWNGFIYWQGDGKVTISSVQLTKNDTEEHGVDSEVSIKSGELYNYITTTNILGYKEDLNTLTITWTDKNGDHEETIRLKPKKRFFVVPTSIF